MHDEYGNDHVDDGYDHDHNGVDNVVDDNNCVMLMMTSTVFAE